MDDLSRRSFLFSLLVAPTIGMLSFSRLARAADGLPDGKKMISESDPTAMALGYKHDAAKADANKYPQLKKPESKTQRCDNCNFYTKENEKWGKCQLLQAGLVNSKGWCGSWFKKI